MTKNSLTWKIGGEAGFGIMAAGQIMAKALMKAGLYIVSTTEYPSLVRGGHNVYLVRASEQEIFSIDQSVELLVALNEETIKLHKDELTNDAVVLYDAELVHSNDLYHPTRQKKDSNFFSVPLLKLATENGGEKIMMNNVALGASWAVIGLPLKILTDVITEIFTAKGEEVVKENIKVATAGYDFIKNNLAIKFPFKLNLGKAPERLLLTGNESIGLGAIKAGLGAAFIYPMTPINGLLTYLADQQKENGFVFKQPEDEISVINMAIGSSYGGKRSLVATSGGGFSLMTEGYGMAAMTETPLVIVMGTRPGPSSGLPTWTGQGDLKFVLNAGQGEFMRVVLAPGDVTECYEMTQTAFSLAEKYQTPVILLLDKFLCESLGTIEMSNVKTQISNVNLNRGKPWDGRGGYKRYLITEDGISPRALLGQTYFVTNSYEHDEMGYSTEDAQMIKEMMDKRQRKYETLAKETPEPVVYGDSNADVTLVGWGSTKGAVLEALRSWKLEAGSWKLNYLHLNWINPFPKEAVRKILGKAKRVIIIEGNANGQMAGWIKEQTGIEIKDKILKYNGRPFYPEEIYEYFRNK